MTIPFLSIGPRVKVTPHTVELRTATVFAVITLGTKLDRVVVDSRTKTVRLRRRRLWAFSSLRTIPFDEIKHVGYGMQDWTSGLSYVTGEREGPETFTAALTLRSGEEVPLARFTGEGAYVSDVSFGLEYINDKMSELSDVMGNQQESSLSVIDLLCERLGVGLGNFRG